METCIAERLQKLKQWQVEQQEKLLKQQQIQREILSHNQDYIYKALGFSVHDFYEDTENIHGKETDTDESVCGTSMIHHNTDISDNILKMTQEETLTNADILHEDYEGEETKKVNHISTINDENENSTNDYSSSILSPKKDLNIGLLAEGKKSRSSNNTPLNKYVSVDDIPVPLPKKDFQTLLEEKLRTESDVTLNACTNPRIKTRKPFLKKGEGLSRFKMSVNSHSPLTTNRKHSASLSLNTQHNNGTVHRTHNKTDKNKKSITSGNVSSKSTNNIALVNGMQQLSLKTVSSPRNKLHTKSESITPTKQSKYNAIFNRTKHLPEINVSDFDSKTERELEEVRIFELLEEKAENSSFCSTSSTVLAFLQQSTPFKVKEKLNYRESNGDIVIGMKQQNSKQISDKEPMLEQRAHIKNFKSNIIKQLEQFNVQNKHSRIYSTTVDSYWDTVNEQEETQEPIVTNQISQNNEAYLNHSQNHDVSSDEPTLTVSSSSSDEEEDVSAENDNLTHADASHRVRFSERNEYRTIDLVDVSNTSNKSPLKDHLGMGKWNDCSVNMLDINTSDATEKLPLNYEQYRSSLKALDHEEAINASIRLALQYDIATDSLNRVITASSISKEENTLHYEDESSGEDICDDNECSSITEETVQTSNEEHSISSLYPPSLLLSNAYQKLSTRIREDYVPQDEPGKVMNEIVELYSNAKEMNCYPHEERTDSFRPELLKSRLLELENEIDIFRKESSALLLQRRKLQEDQMTLYKEYMEKERKFEENKRKIQNQLEEEREKLAHEKITIENRARDIQEKAKQNKIERQKMQNLQEQLEKLRDELNIKESKWNISEARYKTELRILQSEISNLKQKISSLQNVKKTNLKNTKKIDRQIITKTINENKRIVATPSKEVAKTSRELLNVSLNASVHDYNDNKNKDKNKIKDRSTEAITKAIDINDDLEKKEGNVPVNRKEFKQRENKSQSECKENSAEQIATKKRNTYESLLKDATSDLVDDQNPFHIMQDISNFRQPTINAQTDNSSSKDNDEFYSDFSSKDIRDIAACVMNDTDTDRVCLMTQDRNKSGVRTQNEESPPEKKTDSNSMQYPSLLRHQSSSGTDGKDTVKQIQHSDGRIEYWYPNGNVKKIFPDQGVIKMIYYNGDVRENDKDGKVRYFYATTRAWHTTTSDGLEILEFSDGQVEKRMSDGTVKVSFPDGATRIAEVDGTEKWTLPDGTVAQTFTNGDKILVLPNGQREVHTKEHKRREYPDGTVKLVYADGTQETRYSNGRKRLKDKDGNLLMDSYSS